MVEEARDIALEGVVHNIREDGCSQEKLLELTSLEFLSEQN